MHACMIIVVVATTGLVLLLCTYISTLETKEQGQTDGSYCFSYAIPISMITFFHCQQSLHVCVDPLLCLSLSLCVCLCLCLCSCIIEDQSCFSLHDVRIDFLLASIVMGILVTSLQRILLVEILAKSSSCNNICEKSL